MTNEFDCCPTCGSPVRVVSSDEGTSYYEPLVVARSASDAARRAERKAVDDYVSASEPFVPRDPAHVEERHLLRERRREALEELTRLSGEIGYESDGREWKPEEGDYC